MKEKCHFCEYERGPLKEQSEMCTTCRNFNNFQVKKRLTPSALYEYEKLTQTEEQLNDQNVVFDRDTALMVLKDLSANMRPSHDIFGNGTLTIKRYNFELIRKKYLDRKVD